MFPKLFLHPKKKNETKAIIKFFCNFAPLNTKKPLPIFYI